MINLIITHTHATYALEAIREKVEYLKDELNALTYPVTGELSEDMIAYKDRLTKELAKWQAQKQDFEELVTA